MSLIDWVMLKSSSKNWSAPLTCESHCLVAPAIVGKGQVEWPKAVFPNIDPNI